MGTRVLRRWAKLWLPPFLVERIQRAGIGASGQGVRWQGAYASWDEATALCEGYDKPIILERMLVAAHKVRNGEAAYDRDTVTFAQPEYNWLLLSGLFWTAARLDRPLEVLDFGGALGSSYFQHKRFLDALPGLRWHVVEQPQVAEAGRRELQDETLRFHDDLAACVAGARIGLVLLSGVVQYIPRPHELLQAVAGLGAPCLVYDRTPFTLNGGDRLTVQTVPEAIYPASYPCWFLDRDRFLGVLLPQYELVASAPALDSGNIPSRFEMGLMHRRNPA